MKVEFTDFHLEFGGNLGGFPSKVVQHLRNGRISKVLHTDAPWLTVQLADGRMAIPQLREDYVPQMRRDEDGTVHLQYNNVPFAADGETLFDWRLCLDYEICPDGNCFIAMHYEALEQHKPPMAHFTLRIPMDFGDEDDVTYEYWPRPRAVDPTGISQVANFVRNLREKKPLDFNLTVPMIGFDFGREGRPSRHIEWFVEDQMSLDESPDHVSTRLTWVGGSPVLEYEFATQGAKPHPYPYYWRNKIGFTLGQTPKIRDKAPLRLYHYIDQYENYPTAAQIRKMAAEGADVLNLHECWRGDARNGGYPMDRTRFQAMIAQCHRNGIRVAPYIRGDETSAKDNACNWFGYYLEKDFDGLYADYGSPWGFLETNMEYAGGRIGFKAYYKHCKRLRERTIGRDGVFTVHTGPFFAGSVIASMAEGYVSGEGERGILLHSRREHAFFSQSTTAVPSLWTAAFPAYRTERMLPFMANLGQFPHVALGDQWHSSVCAGSREPGNVTFARPLWKLYGLMKGERQLRFDNDLCDESLVCDSYDTGVSRFTMQDGSVLILLSNFADKTRLCSTNLTLEPTNGQRALALTANYEGCSDSAMPAGTKVERALPAYGICGFLVYPESEKWALRLDAFAKPYPAKDAADLAYDKLLEDAAKARKTVESTEKLYVKAVIPYYPGTIERDFWKDLYDQTYVLTAVDASGHERTLGYVSRRGLTRDPQPMDDALWPCDDSGWIPLHELLGKGRYTLTLRALAGENPGSMQAHVLLSDRCDDASARDIVFYGELDEDRSRLVFDIDLA